MILAQLPQVVIDVGAGAGALVAVLAAFAAVWKIPAVRNRWTRHVTEPRRAQHREDVAAVLEPMIAPLRHELQTNGGSSLKDAVRRVEQTQERELAERAARQDAMDVKFDSIDAELIAAREWRDNIMAKVEVLTDRP